MYSIYTVVNPLSFPRWESLLLPLVPLCCANVECVNVYLHRGFSLTLVYYDLMGLGGAGGVFREPNFRVFPGLDGADVKLALAVLGCLSL